MSEKLAEEKAGRIAEQYVSSDDLTDWQFPYDRVTAKDIRTFTTDAIAQVDELLRQVIESDDLTWDSVMVPLSAVNEELTRLVAPIYIMSNTHPSKKIRDAARKAELSINLYDNSIWHRTELFEKVRSYAETKEAESLEEEQARYLRLRMQALIDRGHNLDPEDRLKIRELEDRMSVYETNYLENITKDKSRIALGKRALKGMPAWYIRDLERSKEGKYIIDIDPANVGTTLSSASDRDTRNKVNRAAGLIAADTNGPLLEEMRTIRHEIASLLGHKSWAHFQLEQCMLTSPDEVRALYQRLIGALQPKAEAEVAVVANMLHEDGHDDVVRSFDMMYYASKLMTEKDLADGEKIIEYFPLKSVLKELFAIDRELYGLRYKRMKDVPVWHEDVLVYGLHDETTDELQSVLYLDLFTRKGKGEGAFQIPMQTGRRLPDGSYLPTTGAIIADFSPAGDGMPPVLSIEEIHTLTHEKGHFLQLILSEAEIAEFTLGNHYFMGRDYMELPSQVAEKWAEDAEILHRLSSHYKTGKKLPVKKIERYLETQKINEASAKLARFALHLTDLDIHDEPDGRSIEEILRENTRIGIVPYDEGIFPLAADTHMIDYSAVTSGYDVTEVFAYDIFDKFKAAGLTNRRIADEFRNKMLRFAGSQDGLELTRNMLGRDPNPEAYLRSLGVSE